MIVDQKYIGLISVRLQKFSKRKHNLFTFRCPYCGDSKKNKNRTRGYFYQHKTDFNYKCHNCGKSTTFTNFLKDMDTELYDQYILERYREGLTGKGTVAPEPKFEFSKPVFKKGLGIPKASTNPKAEGYLTGRKLDPDKFYYAERYMEFVNKFKKTYDVIGEDHPRIIIPFYDEEKNLLGFQGRSLSGEKPKYLTTMLSEDNPKIYGLDKINKNETVYITEGPFDSTLIRNACAMCGADLILGDLGINDCCYIYDNEPRNREITTRIGNAIDRGFKVVIWPRSNDHKDINDMVIAGLDVQTMIKSHTYQGMRAKLEFTNWKK